MRRKEDRTSQILELLVKEKKIEVSELSAHLGVSQVTVRKDLDAMEAQGLITREHGFAVLSSWPITMKKRKRSRCALRNW